MRDVSPLGNDVSPAQLARGVDRLCDRFEAAWKQGGRPRLERYLAQVPATVQPELLRELLMLELEYGREKGEQPELAEYHRRFPQHATLLDALFSEGAEGTTPSPYLLRKWAATVKLISNNHLSAGHLRATNHYLERLSRFGLPHRLHPSQFGWAWAEWLSTKHVESFEGTGYER